MLESWQTVDIGGHSADYFAPAGGQARFGVLFLHGYDLVTLAKNQHVTAMLNHHRLACLCPHSQRSWWTDRIWPPFSTEVSTEQFLLQSALPFLQERAKLGPRNVGLLGYCMGGQGALRLAFKHSGLFPIVAAAGSAIENHELFWSGTAIDDLYASKEECRQDTAPLHVHPSHYPPHIRFDCDPADPWWRGNDRLHEKLAALGISHECDLKTRAGGHSWAYFDRKAGEMIPFLVGALEKESRRLLG